MLPNLVEFDTIIFDLDGTILDTSQRHYIAYRNIMEMFGYREGNILPRESYLECKRLGIDRYELLSFSNATQHYDRFLSSWLEIIEDKEYLKYDKLFDTFSVPAVLNFLAQKKKLVLATMRNNYTNLYDQLSELSIDELFDEIILIPSLSNSDKRSVSFSKYFLPNRTLFVGDTEKDIESARILNSKVCVVTCGLRSHSYLQSMSPDYIVSNISKLIKI